MTLTKAQQNKLITEHYGFIRSCVVKFWKRHNWLELDECVSEAMVAAVESAHRYDPDKVPFSIFIEDTIKWRMAKMLRTSGRRITFSEVPDLEERTGDTIEIEDAVDSARLYEKVSASPLLSRRLLGRTIIEIGEEDGVSKTTVMRREERELRGLRAFRATNDPARVNIQTTVSGAANE